VPDANSQSRSGSSQSEALSTARAWLRREVDLDLEFVPKVPRQRAAATVGALPVNDSTGAAERCEQATAARAQAGGTVAGAAPGAGASDASGGQAAAERPAVRELPDLLVEPEVRSAASLDALRAVIGDCSRCKLCKGRTNIVFGVGSPTADLMFVGEGPGEDEDRQGIPFVGRAGMLLTDIITKGMGLARSDVYIANVVKCRPPQNRNPEPDEIVACEPFLHRQIALIRPRVIVTLGKFATQVLLRSRTPISHLRGKWHDYQGVPLMPTFHPAYLLRNPSDKRVVWEDIKQVMARLDLPVPSRPS
jgi:DNA polymerase